MYVHMTTVKMPITTIMCIPSIISVLLSHYVISHTLCGIYRDFAAESTWYYYTHIHTSILPEGQRTHAVLAQILVSQTK